MLTAFLFAQSPNGSGSRGTPPWYQEFNSISASLQGDICQSACLLGIYVAPVLAADVAGSFESCAQDGPQDLQVLPDHVHNTGGPESRPRCFA